VDLWAQQLRKDKEGVNRCSCGCSGNQLLLVAVAPHRGAQQRFRRAGDDGDAVQRAGGQHAQRIVGDLVDGLITSDGRDANQFDTIGEASQKNSQSVIMAWVRVQPDGDGLFRHQEGFDNSTRIYFSATI
jgi:hypothetical protein